MSFKLNPERLKRYKNIIHLIVKYAGKDFKSGGDDQIIIDDDLAGREDVRKRADEFTAELESLGPTFIKLGQLLSSRPDFLPMEYIDALSRLQDSVEPFSAEEAEKIVEEELSVKISRAFSEFDAEPFAAASIGQVHFAKMRDGRSVAVKIQRPGIQELIAEDLEALEEIARSLDSHTKAGKRYKLQGILAEFKKSLIKELDYLVEASNLRKMGRILNSYDAIFVPAPINDYCSKKVLTMDYVDGKKVTSLSGYSQYEIDGEYLARQLFQAYLDQILVHGFFHADPHPGNILITYDHKIGLIDLGMTSRIDPEMRENLIKLLLYISEGKGKDAARLSFKLGIDEGEGDTEKYIQEAAAFISEYSDVKVENIQVGRVVMELTRIAAGNGIVISSELTMLGKALINLDTIGKTLDPKFDPNRYIKSHVESILRKHMMKNLSPGNIFSSTLELNEFVQKLPVRLNNFMDAIAANKLKFRIDALDEAELMFSLQKIANRITMGIVLAALIIGAALMMNVKTEFTILGYPGLAVIFFIIAALGAFGLLFSILLGDKWPKGKHF